MHATRTKGRDLTAEQQRLEFQREYERQNADMRGREGSPRPAVVARVELPKPPPTPRSVLLDVLRERGPLTLAELTHAAFLADKTKFGAVGLQGEPIPCTHKVKDNLYGETGLLKKGRVRSLEGKKYTIAENKPCAS